MDERLASATEILRRLLDERGVEYFKHEDGEPLRKLEKADEPATSWHMGGASVCAVPIEGSDLFDLWIDHCTPEQAIAATLGDERLAFLEEKVKLQGDYIYKLIKEKHELFAQNCEAATRHAAQMDRMGRKLEAATLGGGECELVEVDSYRSDMEIIHVLECSACGKTCEHVNGSYPKCPHCGAKAVKR